MKKILTLRIALSVVAFLLVAPRVMQAQTSDSLQTGLPKTMLKTAPVHLEELNFSVEKFHRPNRSLQVGAGYIYRTLTNTGAVGEPRGQEVNGMSLRLSYRMYPEKKFASPQGGYHGPLVTYRYMSFPVYLYQSQANETFTVKERQQVFSLQYLLGIQRVFKKWFVVDAYAGLGGRLKYATEKDTGPEGIYSPAGTNYYGGRFYGYRFAAGPDWVMMLAPSISLNIAIGVVL